MGTEPLTPQEKFKADLALVQDQYDADVLAYVGPLFSGLDDRLLKICRERRRRKNILVILETPGGSADAAYRVGRALQRSYPRARDSNLIMYVHGYCKSAGTILALAADRIIMSQEAQLGPIDVQLRKEDEVGERTSGLTPHQALDTLAGESTLHFRRFFKHFRYDDELLFTTRMAAELASSMTVGLMSPIYEQIDPLRMGEIERFVRISSEYAERLRSPNVRADAVERLAAAYPSHGFVIDREEAEERLFAKVEKPSDELERVSEMIITVADGGEPFIRFLNGELAGRHEGVGNGEQTATERTRRARKGAASTKVRPHPSRAAAKTRVAKGNGKSSDIGEAEGA